jgi:hypothetical protein
MRQTFFDSLLISDSERIHSQTFAWIISLDNSVFSNDNKAKFLAKLFNVKDNFSVDENLYVETELNKIDIFIQTKDRQFLIENKLKSSEHSQQTIRLVDSIPKQFVDLNKTQHFVFLTLIKDEPLNSEWIPVSFEKLRDSLIEIDWDANKKETIFIKEYIQTLDNLVKVFNQFVSDHKAFKNVFTDGYKKKFEKNSYVDESHDYIRKNQLETIFQKAFLKIIANEAEINPDEISETRGTALMQVHFGEVSNFGKSFRLGFQFQGKTMKINLAHEDYADSKTDQIDALLTNKFKEIFYKQGGYNRFNKPRSKAYISVSKQVSDEIYEIDKNTLINLIKGEITYITKKMQELN